MERGKRPAELTLLDILIDGFEKNETLNGYHWRDLPMPDADLAARKFETLAEEARRWKGPPIYDQRDDRRVIAWPDLEIRQAGNGIRVLVRAPRIDEWWHDNATWEHDPMGPIRTWLREERDRKPGGAGSI